jgi:hypothetical protein
MTKTLATEITIDAPPARVWQILTDLPGSGTPSSSRPTGGSRRAND